MRGLQLQDPTVTSYSTGDQMCQDLHGCTRPRIVILISLRAYLRKMYREQKFTSWIQEMQCSLSGNPKFAAWKRQFTLFTDKSGVWRCGGRLTNADLPFETRHPILLDSQHPLTTLIVLDAHARVKHDGVRETLMELRSRYWMSRLER